MLRALLVALLLLLPLGAAADPDVTQPPQKAKPPAAPAKPVEPVADPLIGLKKNLTVGKIQRDYYLYTPRKETVQPRPLVIVLHSTGGNAKGIAELTHFTQLADRENFLVAYPEGTGRLPTWNAGRCCGYASRTDVDDSEFIRLMIQDIRRNNLVDKTRIYATGFSNGGMMAYRLACDIGENFAAIAVVAGAMNTFTCKPKARPSLIIFHAKNDNDVLYEGGAPKSGYRAALAGKPVPDTSVKQAMDFWIKQNMCRNFPSKENTSEGEVINYFCAEQRDVRLYTLSVGGHSWPGQETDKKPISNLEEDRAELPSTLPASELIWEFFSKHPPREVF